MAALLIFPGRWIRHIQSGKVANILSVSDGMVMVRFVGSGRHMKYPVQWILNSYESIEKPTRR